MDTDPHVLKGCGDITMAKTDEDKPDTPSDKISASAVDPVIEDEKMEDDEVRAEATFRFKLTGVSKMKERDSHLSDPCMVRGLPWKILAMQRISAHAVEKHNKSLGFFLQCNADSESTMWSCHASAELKLIAQREGTEHVKRSIHHLFYSKENDWGFSHFITWDELIDPHKGFIKDDSIILEVWVRADAPHGVCWDSKKHTGFVGLKNQGATCYMNSLLQTLFFTNQLRKAVYMMPTDADDPSKSVPLALQRVFYELQTSDKAVGTKKLTKSFGWETLDSFMQHDVQELSRVLLDNMESKMKGTCVEGTIPRLFEGKMLSYIKCKHINYVSERQEAFYDIQLRVKGQKDLDLSFKNYTAVETLDGDNKYDAGEHGMQEAEKGVSFISLPPVLHLQLLRFHYDPAAECMVKDNDRFEFFEEINLDDYLKTRDPSDPAIYVLHAVLVHSGDIHGGHYVVYIKSLGDGQKWCKFDDDVVSTCTKQEAIDHNFGGSPGEDDDSSPPVRNCTNAYMLVYMRRSKISSLLEAVREEDIPDVLVERLTEEKRVDAQRRRERNEAHLYLTVRVLTDHHLGLHHGADLIDTTSMKPIIMRVKKNDTFAEMLTQLSHALKYRKEEMRIWPLATRTNGSLRPMLLDLDDTKNKTIWQVYQEQTLQSGPNSSPFLIWVELPPPHLRCLPAYNKERDVLFMLKYYDRTTRTLSYVGHTHLNIAKSLENILPVMRAAAGLPANCDLLVYEEVSMPRLEQIHDIKLAVDKVFDELIDGDILVFEKAVSKPVRNQQCQRSVNANGVYIMSGLDLPNAPAYFRYLAERIDVHFRNRHRPNEDEFILELTVSMKYHDIVKAVAEHLRVDDSLKIQLIRTHNCTLSPTVPVKGNFDGVLKDLINQQKAHHLFYDVLAIRVTELEVRRQLQILWTPIPTSSGVTLTIYPLKSGTVKDILDEVRRAVPESDRQIAQQPLRLLEIFGYRISTIHELNAPVESLGTAGTTSNKIFRVEPIPKDEVELTESEAYVYCAHFHKDAFSTHSSPFVVKLTDGELWSKIRSKVLEKADALSDSDNVRLALIQSNKPVYIQTESTNKIDIDNFRVMSGSQRPWIGIDHPNRSSSAKRTKYSSYMEKAIKIHN